MKVLAIVGSLRKESFNLQLAKMAGEILTNTGKVDFEILEYSDIPYFNEDIENPTPERICEIREKVKEADGIWIFTPEYNHFFSGVLKNLLDWLSRATDKKEKILAKKPVAISGTTPGMTGTALAQDNLVTLLSFLDMRVMNAPRLTIPTVFNQLDENGKLTLNASYKYLERQATSFVSFIENK